MAEKWVAIVTGGAQGFGRAIVEKFLEKGHKVCIADINAEKGNATTRELSEKFGSSMAMFVTCDVTRPSDISNVFETVLKSFQRVDVLVNNAGIVCEENVENTFAVNVMGVINGCKAAMEYMGTDKGGKGGTVVNIASILGLIPFDILPYYTASKHAVVGLTRSLGSPLIFDKHGLTFNAICPTYINTEQLHWKNKDFFASRPDMMEPSYVADAVMKLLADRKNGAALAVTKDPGWIYINTPCALRSVDLH